MTKARDLANFVSAGNPLADSTIDVADINGVTATTAEINYIDGVTSPLQTQLNVKVAKTGDTGAAFIPVGTEAQRPTPAVGQLRFNSDVSSFEGYNGTEWGGIGGGGGPAIEAVASGSLTDGSTVIVNADGTVSVVSGVAQELGTSSVFGGIPGYLGSTFDSLNNKVVISYRDDSNSSKGTVVVGTVSGTSISFGTPVVFDNTAAANHIAITFDSSNNKIVIAYQDQSNSDFGTALVGTVSGTSISFGTPVVFRSATTQLITAVFDTLNNKVVISFAEPNVGKAIVGTVSGTSISFGAIATFEAANNVTYLATTFDNINNKVVQAYRGGGVNLGYGTAVVGTVSGTSISFGASATFEAASILFPSATFDSLNGKVIVVYRDAGNSSYGTVVVGTVSGTVITFGTPSVFFEATTTTPHLSFDPDTGKVILAFRDDVNAGIIKVGTIGGISNNSISFVGSLSFTSNVNALVSGYDSFNDKVVIAYRDSNNSGFATGSVFSTGSTNLTEGNFLGFSDGAYSNTQTATIQLVGSIDDAQSGLTAGQKYYVQLTGGLGTTPADPEVYAGIAVAADKIVIKG